MLTYHGNVITKHTDVNNWLIPIPDSKYSWKLLNKPIDTYAVATSEGSQLFMSTWPSFVTPDWLDGHSRLELRGRVSDGTQYSGSSSTGATTLNSRLNITYDLLYNKYYLFDLYGWYYCEGKISSVVQLNDGQMSMWINQRGSSNVNNKVFNITLTPSNVVDDIAQYSQNNTNTITYSNNHQDTFVQDPTYKLINFKCLVDMVHNRVYNCVQYTGETYAPYDDIESITWNYYGTLTDNIINAINANNTRLRLYVQSGSFHTGITNWYQSGITWGDLTISGCCHPHLNIHYR